MSTGIECEKQQPTAKCQTTGTHIATYPHTRISTFPLNCIAPCPIDNPTSITFHRSILDILSAKEESSALVNTTSGAFSSSSSKIQQ